MTMKCYVCAKQGVDKDAVAICIVCGMGLCLGHAFKEELLVRDIIDWGFGEERIEYPHTLPRFICAECKLAREQRNKVNKKQGADLKGKDSKKEVLSLKKVLFFPKRLSIIIL